MPSIRRMEAGISRNEKLMGSMYGKIGEFIYGRDDDYSIDGLCSDLQDSMARLPEKE